MLQLAGAIGQLWLAGNITEGRRWLTGAPAIAPHRTRHRIRALDSSVSLALMQQHHVDAQQLLDESLSLAAELGDRSGEAEAWLWLGFLELNGDPLHPPIATDSPELPGSKVPSRQPSDRTVRHQRERGER